MGCANATASRSAGDGSKKYIKDHDNHDVVSCRTATSASLSSGGRQGATQPKPKRFISLLDEMAKESHAEEGEYWAIRSNGSGPISPADVNVSPNLKPDQTSGPPSPHHALPPALRGDKTVAPANKPRFPAVMQLEIVDYSEDVEHSSTAFRRNNEPFTKTSGSSTTTIPQQPSKQDQQHPFLLVSDDCFGDQITSASSQVDDTIMVVENISRSNSDLQMHVPQASRRRSPRTSPEAKKLQSPTPTKMKLQEATATHIPAAP